MYVLIFYRFVTLFAFVSSIANPVKEKEESSLQLIFRNPMTKNSTQTPIQRPNTSIQVGSYNIKNQDQASGLIVDFQNIKHIDVLAMQEVNIATTITHLHPLEYLFEIQSVWPFWCALKVNQRKDKSWEGHLIVSRFYIQKCGTFDLNHSGQKKRKALWAEIVSPHGKPFLFVNTDHETNRSLTLGYPDRKLQLESLMFNLNHCLGGLPVQCQQLPVVIVGDFNTIGISLNHPIQTYDEVKKTILYLKGFGFQHIQACDHHQNTYESILGNFELDHIFFRNNTEGHINNHSMNYSYKSPFDGESNESEHRKNCRKSLNPNFGSDHHPIWTTLNL